jgi:hypothetical protein
LPNLSASFEVDIDMHGTDLGVDNPVNGLDPSFLTESINDIALMS